MSLLLLLGAGGGSPVPPEGGVTLEALGIRVLLEVSESQPFAAEQAWHDFSGYIHRTDNIIIDRGRSSEFDEIRAGTLDLRLDASSGDLDPNNLASPVVDCLKPRRRCRLRIVHEDITYPVFSGFTVGWPRSYARPNTQALIPFSATDGFRVLQNVDPTGGLFTFDDPIYGRFGVGRFGGTSADDQLSGELIAALLDSVAWPSDLRELDTGRVVVSGELESMTALSAMRAAEAAEGGAFFFDREGNAVLRDRLAIYEDERSIDTQATFAPVRADPPAYTEPLFIAFDDTRIINSATYTGASGIPQAASDPDSISEYGINETSASLISTIDTDAKSLAVIKVAQYAEPRDRIEQIVINAHTSPDASLPAVLGRELFDRLAIVLDPPNRPETTVGAIAQGIRHEISRTSFVTTFRLGPAPTELFFRFDDPTYGQFDGVGVFAP